MSIMIDLAEDRDGALAKASELLQSGSVVVLPLDGVYAIVADAFRHSATQRIFAARRRSRATPLPVLLRTERQVGGLCGDVPEYADRLMAAYWPGDLTLILPASEDLNWDLGNGKGTVQVRLPVDEFVRSLIASVGPLACTSANRLSQDRPRTVEDAKAQMGVLIPLYLDGGPTDGHVSTIVDATGPSPVVHREGAVPESHIHVVAAGELNWGERPDPGSVPAVDAAGASAADVPEAVEVQVEAEARLEDLQDEVDALADRAEELAVTHPVGDHDGEDPASGDQSSPTALA